MTAFSHPDFSAPRFTGAVDARFVAASADGVLPEGFFSTTNLPTYGAPPGGGRPGNAWSIRDMHGDVQEWCRSSVSPNLPKFAKRGGPADRDLRLRPSARDSELPFLRINRVGFRIVLVRRGPADSTLDPSS